MASTAVDTPPEVEIAEVEEGRSLEPTLDQIEERRLLLRSLDARGIVSAEARRVGSAVELKAVPAPHSQLVLDQANAVGVAATEVAKTVVLTTDRGYVRAVVPASERLDLGKTRDLLDDRHSRLATEAELGAAYPAFELGAVPPFGGPSGDRVILDLGLAKLEEVVLEAGSHDQSVKMRTSDLLTLSGAESQTSPSDHPVGGRARRRRREKRRRRGAR